MSWLGSWSPFGMRQGNSSPVTSNDFSYISPEDLENEPRDRHPQSSVYSEDGRHADDGQHRLPRRRPRRSHTNDIVVLKYKQTHYPVHFPPWSIDDGEMTVGDLRDAAAQTLGVQDARRVRLFLLGKQLKEDGPSLREENFHSQEQPTVLTIVGEPLKNPHPTPTPTSTSSAPAPQPTSRPVAGSHPESRDDDEEGSSTDDNSLEPSSTVSSTSSARKKKKRRNHRSGKRKPETSTSETSRSTSGHAPQVEFLPSPNLQPPTRPSASTSRQPSPHPVSQTEKLEQLARHFHDSLLPLCKEFAMYPPQDKAKRDYEYKKLSETVLQQVLLKTDAVEVEGVEGLRAKRKELVREVQGWLTALDEVVK